MKGVKVPPWKIGNWEPCILTFCDSFSAYRYSIWPQVFRWMIWEGCVKRRSRDRCTLPTSSPPIMWLGSSDFQTWRSMPSITCRCVYNCCLLHSREFRHLEVYALSYMQVHDADSWYKPLVTCWCVYVFLPSALYKQDRTEKNPWEEIFFERREFPRTDICGKGLPKYIYIFIRTSQLCSFVGGFGVITLSY